MKVVHIFREFKFSGAEIMYVDAASIFQANGCELSAVAIAKDLGDYAPYFKEAGYSLYHKPCPKNYLKRFIYYIKLIVFLKKEKFDVLHIHTFKAMWTMALCAWIVGINSVYTFHNVFSTHYYSFIYHYLLRWSAKRIFNCHFQSISTSVYQHELKLYKNKTIKIYNWYNNGRFYPADYTEKLHTREQLNIDTNALVLISIGGCSIIKQHSEIIKALPLIADKHPNCLYLHLGEGNLEHDEITLAQALNVTDYVRFCGNQSNVRKYLIAADIYIMPSRFEGISITTIEAMACSIPTILYDVPGLRDFNETGENSILVAEDYRLLVEKSLYLYEDSQFANEMASRAKGFVNHHYSMRNNAIEILKLYNNN